ncbi:gas vesicle protein GvpG [Jiangella sp. DSM 45060]|uniref:gas vesicle protein GvpG n=1 Tax=Jiangella sp. DSM 45060 TaxID=1798224 RepID=UPI00087CFE7D|nr:gas vesicle protein GvpG [Jiangella sp. DSM 45060]SDT45638.1 Gas vesicle protein G [Jiangella sp. DSM 45060]
MGVLTVLVTWPLASVRGAVAAARLVADEAERQYRDPVAVRQALEQVEQARAAGLLSEEEAAAMEDELIGRLL